MLDERMEEWIVFADRLESLGDGETAKLVSQAIGWANQITQDSYGLRAVVNVGPLTIALRLVGAGSYPVGSPAAEGGRYRGPAELEQRVHRVSPFWIGEVPVTRELWRSLGGAGRHRASSDDCPIAGVCLSEATDFALRLSHESGAPMRLPTELEWEVACRAGTTAATWIGDVDVLGPLNAPQLGRIAWYGGNSIATADTGYRSLRTVDQEVPHAYSGLQPVGGKPANPWGLFDMLGNVCELCVRSDEFTYLHRDRDICRGGSWTSRAFDVRASRRFFFRPRSCRATSLVGLRVALG